MPKPYESDLTRFMREWMDKHPGEREVRRTGIALWWDRPQNADMNQRFETARVPVKPYYYDISH